MGFFHMLVWVLVMGHCWVLVFVLGRIGEVEEGLWGAAKDRERIKSETEREYIF